MADNTLNNIRLSLKYDTLANWNASSLVLNAGEVGIAVITGNKTLNGDTAQTPDNTPPAIALKVGDGTHTFNQLPWLQAIAGDVYAWAKAAVKPSYTANEISGLSDYISSQVKDTDTQYKINLDGTSFQLMSKNKGETDDKYTVASSFTLPTYTLVSGTANGTVAFNGADVAVTGLKSAAYTDSSDYATAAQGTKAESAVQSVTIGGVEQNKVDGVVALPAYPTVDSLGAATAADLTAHINNKSNPHGVTKAQIGLGNVTNDAQVKGLATGTTSGHIVTWGDDGYTVTDSGKTVSDFATAAQGTIAENAMPKAGGTFTGAVSGIAPTDDANLTTKAYVDAQIKANAASVFKFKGTVATVGELPTAAADIEGNVYHVTADHGEYVCAKVDGSDAYTWEALGGVIDLSDYALSADVIQRVSGSEGYVPKFNADGTLSSTGFTLGVSVPADAVFTDTKVSNIANSTGKVFTGLTGNTTISTTHVGELVLEGFAVSADSGNIVATDTISTALNKIYNLANSKTSNTGTVTSVEVVNGGGLKVNNSTVTTSGTITITHGDKPTTGTATTNSGRTYIQNITLDAYGHVAGVTTATETVVDTGITSVTANNGLSANVGADRSLTLGITSISTDLLANGTNTLVLNCGTSAV